MCMRIQRPIIAREQHSLYGNAFEMTEHQQHLYECVQPLQGRITFSNDRRDENNHEYRNRFATYNRSDKQTDQHEKELDVFQRVENLLAVFVLALLIIGCVLWSTINDQFAMNRVFLSQFQVEGSSYKMVDAGHTKPLECLIIALFLVNTSLLVGWQSNRAVKRFPDEISYALLFVIAILQILAIIVHGLMFKEAPSMSLTHSGVFGLHLVSIILTLLIFVYVARWLPEKRGDKFFETENTFWLCVVEDLNTIICYVLIYRACDSQVSVHDDAATFFDVVCIVTIGFLQHIANILMIFHGYLHACGKATTDNINNICRTRLLIFFMIGVVTIFLYLRIAPTYTEYPAGVSFEITRSLALIAFISLNSIHSLWYELQNTKTKTVPTMKMVDGKEEEIQIEITNDWETSPAWKLMTTALIATVSGVLLTILVFQYKDTTTFNNLNPS